MVHCRVEHYVLHDHLKECDNEGDRFDFEGAAQYVSSLSNPHCLSNFFSASTLLEVNTHLSSNNTNHYKLRFKSTDKSSAGEEASNACKILSGLDPKCSLRLTLLVAPENLSDKQESGGTALSEKIQEFKTNVQNVKNKLVEIPTVKRIDIRYAATVNVDPSQNKEVTLAQITCDHRDFDQMKKKVDDSSNLWSVVLH